MKPNTPRSLRGFEDLNAISIGSRIKKHFLMELQFLQKNNAYYFFTTTVFCC